MAAGKDPDDPPVALHGFTQRGGEVLRELLQADAPVQFLELVNAQHQPALVRLLPGILHAPRNWKNVTKSFGSRPSDSIVTANGKILPQNGLTDWNHAPFLLPLASFAEVHSKFEGRKNLHDRPGALAALSPSPIN